MKRLVLFTIAFTLAATTAFAFDGKSGPRICVLRTDVDDDAVTLRAASLMRDFLVRELREEGFDAFGTRATYDDLLAGERENADYYVEFVRGSATDDPYGGVGVGGFHGAVELGVVVSRIAANLRVYDARTLDLVEEFDVSARDTAVVPTALGTGRGRPRIWVAVPLLRGTRHRAAAREAARDAAEEIADIIETDTDR